jgi:transmembrane sensor
VAKNQQPIDIRELAEKWAKGKLTQEERDRFEKWYRDFNDEEINLDDSRHANAEEIRRTILNKINAEIYREDPSSKKGQILPLWTRIAAAASILLFLSIGGYFLLHKPVTNQEVGIKPGTFKNDVLPGNKAILTLANGQKIVVNDAKNGTIAQQGSTNISKTANGNIVYAPASTDADITYNTYTIPRGGGKHSLVLADGTLAVLDASSSIRYPTAFLGKDRKVEITGQVYFEVVHNSAKPFFVTAKGQTIEDIGTRFNINVFDDEPGVKTTLLEGSIKVAGTLLKPGQQAIQNDNGKISVLSNVNTAEVIAWKNDLFMFTSNTTLPIVMKQLSRWYDLDVVYQGAGKVYHFGGDMPRNSKLSEVLKILAYSGVQFAVDGKKIIVYQ